MRIREHSVLKKNVMLLALLVLSVIGVGLTPSKAIAADEDYVWAKTMLEEKVSAYDPENQTIVVIRWDTILSHYGEYQDLNLSELGEIKIDYFLTHNGQTPTNRQVYYVLNQANGAVTKKTGSPGDYRPGIFRADASNGNVTALLIDNGTNYNITPVIGGEGWFYSKDGIAYRPHTDLELSGYSATAEGGIMSTNFTYEACKGYDLNTEIWTVNSKLRKIDNPGFIDLNSYLTLKIELRDMDGNVALLKKDWFNNYANNDLFIRMENDGIVTLQINPDGESDTDNAYGEYDIFIPYGYDFRITPIDYGEELGQFAHIFMGGGSFTQDEDGFMETDGVETGKYSTYGMMLDFLPRDQKLTIKNINESGADVSSEYYYQLYQTVTGNTEKWDSETRQYYGIAFPDYKTQLCNYRYRLYDETTNEEIETDVIHKTDSNGFLVLKANQYAVFDVYEYPEDIKDYEGWGFNILDSINYGIGIDAPRPYYSIAMGHEQYSEIRNGQNDYTGASIASGYAGDSIVYVIKDAYQSSVINPETKDDLLVSLGGGITFALAAVVVMVRGLRKRV